MKKEWRKADDRQGFTIIETIVSLMIFSISITIVLMILQGLHREFSDNSTTEFYLYLDVLETHGYKLKNYYSQRLILERGRKVYNVRFNKHKLIMSTDKGGYIPILDNVQSINWGKQNGALESQVQMTDGARLHGRSWLRSA